MATTKLATLDPWTLLETLKNYVRTIFLWGGPGTGKTFAAMQAANSNGQGYVTVTLNEDISVQELFGHYMPKGNEFVFHYGPFADAMKNGKGLIINELQRASGSVKDSCLALMDSNASAKFTLPNGETVSPAEGFKVIVTSNDPLSTLDPALQDRFDIVLHIDRPAPGIIAALNNWNYKAGDIVASSYADPARAISTRKMFAWKNLVSQGVDADLALTAVFGTQADDIRMALNVAKGEGRV